MRFEEIRKAQKGTPEYREMLYNASDLAKEYANIDRLVENLARKTLQAIDPFVKLP